MAWHGMAWHGMAWHGIAITALLVGSQVVYKQALQIVAEASSPCILATVGNILKSAFIQDLG